MLIRGASTDNTIGGPRPNQDCASPCNIIAGNLGHGILIRDAGTNHNTIAGNYIGVDALVAPVPNGEGGPTVFMAPGSCETRAAICIGLQAQDNIIGGDRGESLSCDGPCNVVSGNATSAIEIYGRNTNGNQVRGNFIGGNTISSPAFPPIPNGDVSTAQIRISADATSNVIGFRLTESPTDGGCTHVCNRVIGTTRPGVRISGEGIGNTVRGNSLTGRLGIDLVAPGDQAARWNITPNDEDDFDGGPNDLQNAPSAVTAYKDKLTGITTVSGVLVTNHPELRTVDIYGNPTDGGGFGTGAEFLGTTKPKESGEFRLQLPGLLPDDLRFLSATATDTNGSTSEFSPTSTDVTGTNTPDADGDAICDQWEYAGAIADSPAISGIDFDSDGIGDLNLSALGASPSRKDIPVEIDYMSCFECAVPHWHFPSATALETVRTAWQRPGGRPRWCEPSPRNQ